MFQNSLSHGTVPQDCIVHPVEFLNDADQIGGVSEVPVMENEISLIYVWILIKMIPTTPVEARATPIDTVNDVTFLQQ